MAKPDKPYRHRTIGEHVLRHRLTGRALGRRAFLAAYAGYLLVQPMPTFRAWLGLA
jgi:hypothetical protein